MTSVRGFYHERVAEFAGLYGQRTTVAMMQGSMYNFYDDQARIAHEVTGLSYNAQDMAGFPKHSLANWVTRFTDQGYVVVVMDQFTRRKKNGCEEIYRAPVAVHGPGTPIALPYDCDSAVCAVVYLDNRPEIMGYATFESNTGRTRACEFVEGDFEAAFGGLLGAVLADAPAHTLVVHTDTEDGDAAVARFRERAGSMRVFGKRVDYRPVECVTLRDSHVRETIRRQFDECGLMTGSADTYACLGGRRHAARAFSHLVHFVFRADDSKLRIMETPTLISSHAHLDVAIGGLRQLDIIGKDGVLDHLPRCCTAPGRRAFRQRLCRPSRDAAEMVRRLDVAAAAVPRLRSLRRLLGDVRDFETLHRGLARPATFRPAGFAAMVDSLRLLKEASVEVLGARPHHPADSAAAAFEAVVDVEASRYSSGTVFRPGVCGELDAARARSGALDAELAAALRSLEGCSGAVSESHFRVDESPAALEIAVTRRRFDAAMREARRRDPALEIAGRRIRCLDLSLRGHRSKKSDMVLAHPDLDSALEAVADARRRVRELTASVHAAQCAALGAATADAVFLCARELEDLDVASAVAVMAEDRGFVRPEIVSGKGAFVTAAGLRHPVVEALDGPHEYVGNDVSMDDRCCGMLLYGINGSGKSCLMKSVGIAVCMAQAGMYVSADSVVVGPFARLFTRIWNNDDINRGLSTFSVEASELNQILRHSDSMSLVLGDELCSGTERVSATAIITAGVEELRDRGCRFLLATHQHDVVDMLGLAGGGGGGGVAVRHLSVRTDDSGCLVYERTLRDGVGETTYGVTVCRSLGMPATFLERAAHALRRLQGHDPDYAVSRKRSNYNAGVFMGVCERCGRRPAVHTHHRVPQASAERRVRDAAFNLEPLCAECHESHHRHGAGASPPARRLQTSSGVRSVPADIA
eukprot:jgi/Tetstr1/453958/TSEL_040877.t1